MVRLIWRAAPALAVVAALAACNKSADDHTPTASAAAPAAAVPETQAGTAPGSFALGIVESLEGQEPVHVEPIAHFTGTEWIHAWPNPDDAGSPFPALEDVPTEWLGRPVPRTWALWIADGAPIHAMVLNTFRQKDGCAVPIVLDLNKRASDVGRAGVRGLALSTTQAVTAIRAVDPSDRERIDVLAAATAALTERRRSAVDGAGLHDEDRDALSDAKLAHMPITLDYLYRPATDERGLYYFQVDQWTKPKDMEAPHLSAWGWLRRDGAGQFQALAVQVRAGAGSEEGMLAPDREVPMGVITVRGRTFWILAVNGLESLAYNVYEITSAAVLSRLKNVGGGGC